MGRAARSNHASHEWPVVWLGAPIVAFDFERLIRGVTGEIVVVASMVIARSPAAVSDRANDREFIRNLGRHWEMLAEMDLRCRCLYGAKEAAVFGWCIRLHIPHVDVR